MLSDFYEKTGSEIARTILNGWPLSTSSFIKVFPNDYRKKLEEEKLLKQTAGLKIQGSKALVAVDGVGNNGNNKNQLAVADIEDAVKGIDILINLMIANCG